MRGHIRKRGNNWAVVVDHDRDQDGKRRQKWHSGFRTKRDAEGALNEILNRIGSGTYVDPGRQTMAEYLREWLVAIEPTIRPGTWISYQTHIERHAIPDLGDGSCDSSVPHTSTSSTPSFSRTVAATVPGA